MSSLRVGFAGTPAFGLACLDALKQSQHDIVAVYTQPDRPAGRGRKLQASAVKEWALAQQIAIYQPVNFKTSEALEQLKALSLDVLVVIAYGLILPQAVLDIPTLGCINVHASLLPRWRGASPIQQAILQGDTLSGVTLMQMDAGMDTGAILYQQDCPVTFSDTAGSLHDKLALLAPTPLLATLDALAKGTARPIMQENTLATYAGKITKEDAKVDWCKSALELDRQLRAFHPWPIAYTTVGDEIVRLHAAEVTEEVCSQSPGTVLALSKKGMLVATGDKALLVTSIQCAGGKVIAVADYLNASKCALVAGVVLGS